MHAEAVQAFGANSSAASCFQGVVHVLACSAGYADAVRKSLLGGGENVGRAMLVCLLHGPRTVQMRQALLGMCLKKNACMGQCAEVALPGHAHLCCQSQTWQTCLTN